MRTFERSVQRLPMDQQVSILIAKVRDEVRIHWKAYSLLLLRQCRNPRIGSLYREMLEAGSGDLVEAVLINIDLGNLADTVGTDIIAGYLNDGRWTVRARAAAILYQEGEIGRLHFLQKMKGAEIPDIEKVLVDRYVRYLMRRTLRIGKLRRRRVMNEP